MADVQKQKLLVECLLSDPDLFATCSPIVKSSYFDVSLRKTINFSMEYFEKYKAVPRADVVLAETGIDLTQHELEKHETEYVANEVEQFCRNKAIEAAILGSPALLEKGDFGSIESTLRDAISVSLNRDLGVDYFADPEARIRYMLENVKTIPTGWTEVDEILGGGIAKQELLLFMANSGRGKSITKLNLALNFLKQGLNGLYITLEMRAEVVSKRLDSMITGFSQADIFRNITEVAGVIDREKPNLGKFFVKRMPENTTNALHIRAYLREFRSRHGWVPDFVVIDYLDLMGSTTAIASDNMFIKDKLVAEEIRALGLEFDCLIVSSSQIGRKGLEAEHIDQQHIQGGISKINTADNLIAIVQSDQMRAAGEYLLEFVKTRNAGGVGKKVILRWDPISLRMSDLSASQKGRRDSGMSFKRRDRAAPPAPANSLLVAMQT